MDKRPTPQYDLCGTEEHLIERTELENGGIKFEYKCIEYRSKDDQPRWFPNDVTDWSRYPKGIYQFGWSEVQCILSNKQKTDTCLVEGVGNYYGAETWVLSKEELTALIEGKTLLREINGGEYCCYLKVN